MKIYVLKEKKEEIGWKVIGYYLTYKLAQDDFVYRDGIFKIEQIEVKE